MRTLRARSCSGLLVSLLVAGSVGFTSTSPVVAECPSHDPWPRMREAAPSAKRVIIGTVREATTDQLWEGGPRASTDIRLKVTEHVKGGGPDLIDLGAVVTDLADTRSMLHPFDRRGSLPSSHEPVVATAGSVAPVVLFTLLVKRPRVSDPRVQGREVVTPAACSVGVTCVPSD